MDQHAEGRQTTGVMGTIVAEASDELERCARRQDSWMYGDEVNGPWMGKEKAKMNGEEMQELLIASVKQCTSDVFGTMLGIEVEAGDVYQSNGSPAPTEGVVSLIGLAGPWMGTGSLSCNPQLACKISGALMMSEYAGVDEEVLDAIAEVTNMVMGNVKTILEERVGAMGLSIPTVIFGRNFSTKSAGGSWTVVPFKCCSDKLLVQVCLVKSSENTILSRVGFTNPICAAVK